MQSEMNLHAQDIIEANKANKIAETAKVSIKHYLPDNCRKNGVGSVRQPRRR